MAKKFSISSQEVRSVKTWLHRQIETRGVSFSRNAVDGIRSAEDAMRFIDRELDSDERKRLQVALAVRRSRKKAGQKFVTTQLDEEARDILLKVAHSKNITTSDLIRQVFMQEFLKLP